MGTVDKSWDGLRVGLISVLHLLEAYLLWVEQWLRVPLQKLGMPPGLQMACVAVAAVAVLLLGLKLLEGLLKIVIVVGLVVLIAHLLWHAQYV